MCVCGGGPFFPFIFPPIVLATLCGHQTGTQFSNQYSQNLLFLDMDEV